MIMIARRGNFRRVVATLTILALFSPEINSVYAAACNTTDFEGFVERNGQTYAITKQKMTWSAYKSLAGANGGYAVNISDADLNGFLATSFSGNFTAAPAPSSGNKAWIGLDDPAGVPSYCMEGTTCTPMPTRFTWDSGSSTFTNWATGQPDNFCTNLEKQVNPLYTCYGENWATLNSDGTWSDEGDHGTTPLALKGIVAWNTQLDCVLSQLPPSQPVDFIQQSGTTWCSNQANTQLQQCVVTTDGQTMCPQDKVACNAIYEQPSCPAGSVLNKDRDMCQADPVVTCGIGYTWSSDIDKCVATPICSDGGVFNATSGQCEKLVLNECPTGYTYDATRDVCAMPINCGAGTFNVQDNRCEATPSYVCSDSTYLYNPNDGRCEKPPVCNQGTYNPTYDKCLQPSTLTCPTGYVYNSARSRCEEAPVCSQGTFNPVTNKCEWQTTTNYPANNHPIPIYQAPSNATDGNTYSTVNAFLSSTNPGSCTFLMDWGGAWGINKVYACPGTVAGWVDSGTAPPPCSLQNFCGTFGCSVGVVCPSYPANAIYNIPHYYNFANNYPYEFTPTATEQGGTVCNGYGGNTAASYPGCTREATCIYNQDEYYCPHGYVGQSVSGGDISTTFGTMSSKQYTCNGTDTLSGTTCTNISIQSTNPSCPSGTFDYTNHVCYAPVQTCPTGSTYDSTSGQCVSSATCSNGSLDTSKDVCFQTVTGGCPAGYTLSGSICYSSASCGTSGTYVQATSECQAAITRDCGSYTWSDTAAKCLQTPTCPQDPTYQLNSTIAYSPGLNICASDAVHTCVANTNYTGLPIEKCEAVPICTLGMYIPSEDACYNSAGTCPIDPAIACHAITGDTTDVMIQCPSNYTLSTDKTACTGLPVSGACPSGATVQNDTGSGSGTMCTDQYVYVRIATENPTSYDLQVLDTGTGGNWYWNCGSAGIPIGYGGWRTIKHLDLNVQPASLSFTISASGPGCWGGGTTVDLAHPQSGTIVNCDAGGPQWPSYTYSYKVGDQCSIAPTTTPITFCSPDTCQSDMSSFVQVNDSVAGQNDKKNDGTVDQNGNCLGTFYVFNGHDMRCVKEDLRQLIASIAKIVASVALTATGAGAALAAALQSAGLSASVATAVASTVISSAVTVAGDAVTGQLGTNTLMSVGFSAGLAGLGAVASEYGSKFADAVKSYFDTTVQQATEAGNTALAQTASSAANDAAQAATEAQAGNTGAWDNFVNSMYDKVTSATGLDKETLQKIKDTTVAAAETGMMASFSTTKCCYPDKVSGSCQPEEYKLWSMTKNGLCHVVGEYCSIKWLGACVQTKQTSCCFNSKLARIIQEQGRTQLSTFPLGFGGSESPDCRGFRPEEFQMIDFAKIDLSEYVNDIITTQAPAMQQQLEQSATQYMQKIQNMNH